MREILFRAKAINRDPNREYRTDYKNGDWVYGLISKLYDEDFYEKTSCVPAEMTNENGVSGIDIDYKTICQYTGLTDKNGVKIFEGDILSSDKYPYTSDGKQNYFAEVVWCDSCPAFGLYTFKAPKSLVRGISEGCDFIEGDLSDFEIIGNIYDNPELIGGEENAEIY